MVFPHQDMMTVVAVHISGVSFHSRSCVALQRPVDSWGTLRLAADAHRGPYLQPVRPHAPTVLTRAPLSPPASSTLRFNQLFGVDLFVFVPPPPRGATTTTINKYSKAYRYHTTQSPAGPYYCYVGYQASYIRIPPDTSDILTKAWL